MTRLRPNVELLYLQSIPHGHSYDITKFNAPRALAEKIPGDKYLLPILPFDVGPNNLFRIFKESIPIAVGMNFTLVMPGKDFHKFSDPMLCGPDPFIGPITGPQCIKSDSKQCTNIREWNHLS